MDNINDKFNVMYIGGSPYSISHLPFCMVSI